VELRLVELKAQEHRGIPVPVKSCSVAGYLAEWLEHVVRPSVRPTTCAKYETFVGSSSRTMESG
jgi:hypothetical protein